MSVARDGYKNTVVDVSVDVQKDGINVADAARTPINFESVPGVSTLTADLQAGRINFRVGRFNGVLNAMEPGGAVADGVTDDQPKLKAAIDAMGPAAAGRGLRLILPQPKEPDLFYRLASPWHITRECIIEGNGPAGDLASVIIKPDIGVRGIIIDHAGTAPDGGRGSYSRIQDLRIEGRSVTVWAGPRSWVAGDVCRPTVPTGFCYRTDGAGANGGVEPTWSTVEGGTTIDGGITWTTVRQDGITLFARAVLSFVYVNNMMGNGIYVFGSNPEGSNANGWHIIGGRSSNNQGHGLHVKGIDANVGICSGLDLTDNKGYGVFDQCFFGNGYNDVHTAGNKRPFVFESAVNTSVLFNCYSESDHEANSRNQGAVVSLGGLHATGWDTDALPLTLGPFLINNESWDNDDLWARLATPNAAFQTAFEWRTALGEKWRLLRSFTNFLNSWAWVEGGANAIMAMAGSEALENGRVIMPGGIQLSHTAGAPVFIHSSSLMLTGGRRNRGDEWKDPQPSAGGFRGKVAVRDGQAAPTWAANTVYTPGARVVPTVDNGKFLECVTGGTSGESEPTWDTTQGNTTADGGVTWRCGSNAPVRQNNTAYAKGTLVRTAVDGVWTFRAIVGGVSGGSPPAWPGSSFGQTVTDGTITFRAEEWTSKAVLWKDYGPIAA